VPHSKANKQHLNLNLNKVKSNDLTDMLSPQSNTMTNGIVNSPTSTYNSNLRGSFDIKRDSQNGLKSKVRRHQTK
jgi:hypothetical protein